MENQISASALKKSVLELSVEKNIDLAVTLLKRNVSQRGGFIKTLAEFCSPDCAQVLLSIQEQHMYLAKSFFIKIDSIPRPFSEQENEALFNPPSLTETLFKTVYNAESGKTVYNAESGKVEDFSQEGIDRVLYAESCHMVLTNIGDGLPSSAPIINYQVQEERINKGDVEIVKRELEENNNTLLQLLENTALIGDGRKALFEFASQNAQELHAFLIEYDIPKTLADKVVVEKGIETLEALQIALNDGTIREIPGVGAVKEAKMKAVVASVGSKCFIHPRK